MADERMLVVTGSASIVGALVGAVGGAFGFNRRLEKNEKKVDELMKCKPSFMTKEDHDRICLSTKELTEEKLGRIEDKLDMVLTRIDHCQYNSGGGQ